jgi:hypothetical protein
MGQKKKEKESFFNSFSFFFSVLMKRKNYPTIDGAVQAKSNGKL